MSLDFKSLVREVPDFPKPGIQFKDISPLLASQAFVPAIEAMGALVQKPDYWVGIDARGFLFASALATRLGGGLIICRKKGKLPPPVVQESYGLEYGEDTLEMAPGSGTVVLVDDVYATGGTMKAAQRLCEKAGYRVLDRLVLVDLAFLHPEGETQALLRYDQ